MLTPAFRTGLRIAAQEPWIILWYLENRLRSAFLPLERALGAGRAFGPRFVTLKPTLRCNLRCEFCRFVASGAVAGPRDWMDAADWKRVLDELAAWRPYICFTGGEPLLYPHLPELIAHARSRGMRCVVTTNGTLLRARAEHLAANPPDLLILSIDGPPEVHDRVRGRPGAFRQALEGLAAFRALRGRDGRPYLVLNTVITDATWESALAMLEIAREVGAVALNFQHFWFLTRRMADDHNARWGDCFPIDFERVGGTDTDGVDTEALAEIVERLRLLDAGLPVLFFPDLRGPQLGQYYREPERFTHVAVPACAWIATDILPNGDVSPCFDLVCGNVLRQSFREIWNGAALRAHRQRLARHGPYPICARCCAYFRRD